MEFHPIANLFHLMKGVDFDRLRSSIQANGQREPIWLYDNLIIDGRNRYLACRELGINPNYRTWEGLGPDAEPAEVNAALAEFVLDLNLDRRHLDATRKGILAFDLLPVYEAEARERQATSTGGEEPQLVPNLAQADLGKARDKAAARTGVSHGYVSEIKRIASDHPDYMELMREGEATLQEIKQRIKEGKREGIRAANRVAVAAAPSMRTTLGEQRFSTIVIDPPWCPDDFSETDYYGRADPNYSTMTLEKLAKLPVAEFAEKNCHLYLWAHNRNIPEALDLMTGWGFEHKTILTWCKPSIGLGAYLRNNTEHCLFGIRGSLSVLRNDVGTWFEAHRTGPHSTKPNEFYGIVETVSPAPWLELFARTERPGWKTWGAEAE